MNPFALLGWQRYLVYGALLAALLLAAGIYGYSRGERKLWEYQAEQAKAAVVIVTKRGAVTERVITKYVKVKEKTKAAADEVKKEVEQYAQSNPGQCLDPRWRLLHDAAASNTVPDAAGAIDGTVRAPAAAEALDTVTANYAACHRTADKLDALQEWVREQLKVNGASKTPSWSAPVAEFQPGNSPP